MAWQYSAWRSQPTLVAQLAMLELHMTEATNAVTAEVAGDGKSRSSNAIVQMLKDLEMQREKLARRVGVINGGVSITSHRSGSFSSPASAYEED